MNISTLYKMLGDLMESGIDPKLPVILPGYNDEDQPHELTNLLFIDGPFRADPAPKLKAYQQSTGSCLLLSGLFFDIDDLKDTHNIDVNEKLLKNEKNWRLPTMSEVSNFIQAVQNINDYDLEGACWTSDPYQDSEVTCWVADFAKKPKFNQFHGTHSPNHGYFDGCLRLVSKICEANPKKEPRMENSEYHWIDHHTGLAWQKPFVSTEGYLTYNPNHIWCGHRKHADDIIKLFNKHNTFR